MESLHVSFTIDNLTEFKRKMLSWAAQFSIFCFLEGNEYPEGRSFDTLLAIGSDEFIRLKADDGFSKIQKYYDEKPDWLFGHFGYGLMKDTEGVSSVHLEKGGFDAGFFFRPLILLRIEENVVEITSYQQSPYSIFSDILRYEVLFFPNDVKPVQQSPSREQYLSDIRSLLKHIQLGDCYEANYCQKFFADDSVIDPVSVFIELMHIAPNPFSSLYRVNDNWCICASPERFLKKSGGHILSQPMKGTAPRGASGEEDLIARERLYNSEKDRSENVMIVDLVRNDLSKFCTEGSVKVDELFGIYSFPYVHQMVSTVSGDVDSSVGWAGAVRNCFPMGSMTGAPKKKVLELIDKYEHSARGLFSGSIGYVTPNGDFDFNVVIRSIFYNSSDKQVSFFAGSGITSNSVPELEYEESLWKARAIQRILNPTTN